MSADDTTRTFRNVRYSVASPQHPKSSAIHKLPADYPILSQQIRQHLLRMSFSAF
jgi:hypothetical protein